MSLWTFSHFSQGLLDFHNTGGEDKPEAPSRSAFEAAKAKSAMRELV